MSKKKLSFGLEGIEPHVAEILFVDPNITVEEAARLSGISRKGVDISGLVALLQKSFNSTVQYYRKYGGAETDDYKELCDNVKEKIRLWTSAFGAPELFDLLRLNEYLPIPLSVLTDKSCPSAASLCKVLDHYVIDQQDYTSALSLSFYTHLLRCGEDGKECILELPKSSLLCAGSSGLGKTLALQVLERLYDLSLETVHCNTLVSEGIIGSVVSDALTNAYLKCGNLRTMEYMIIHLDEFDKLFEEGGVYNKRIVNELLNFTDDHSTVSFKDSFERNPSILRIPTKNMMFVYSGVFAGLDRVVEKRLNSGSASIGFKRPMGASISSDALYKAATHQDYVNFGVKPEVMGRISSLAAVSELGVDSIFKIIMNPVNSPLAPFRNYFSLHGISLVMTESGARQIAELVVRRGLGVRAIRQVLQSLLQPFMFSAKVPNNKLVVDVRFVKNKIN